MDDELTDRRGLIRGIAKQVAKRAREVATARSEIRAQLGPLDEPDAHTDAASADPDIRRFHPALLTERCASQEDLLALADECGLSDWRDAVSARCRPSVRLAPPGVAEQLRRRRGEAGLAPHVSWPPWKGAPLTLLLRLDLTETRAVCPSLELPATGSLCAYFVTGDSPSGLALDHRDACRVVFNPEPSPTRQERSTFPTVGASGELTLPRVWAESVDALGLSSEEQGAWERLRLRLAELQGVQAFDTESRPRAIHRVLGWPDERGGCMPLACALIDAGIELGGQPPATSPRAPEFAARAREWRLLLQLAAEPRLGWDWGGKDWLYLWIRDADLAAADFSNVKALVL